MADIEQVNRAKLPLKEFVKRMVALGHQRGNVLQYSLITKYAESRYEKGYADDELMDALKKACWDNNVFLDDDVNLGEKDYEPNLDDGFTIDESVAHLNIPKASLKEGKVVVEGDKVIAEYVMKKNKIKFNGKDGKYIVESMGFHTIKSLNKLFL